MNEPETSPIGRGPLDGRSTKRVAEVGSNIYETDIQGEDKENVHKSGIKSL